MSVIWHDLECGRYAEDLPFWRQLAAESGGPVLDVGAGTGRVALELARAGHQVTALDLDAVLLDELGARAAGLVVDTVVGDARRFALGRRFALCIVPMQTIQLLGGPDGRRAFLARAGEHLLERGLLAIALADELDVFEVPEGAAGPLPDVCELDGVVYSSRPTAVRAEAGGFVLERTRETVTVDGSLSALYDEIRLDSLGADQLEHEGVRAGLRPAGQARIAATQDYVGSVVVIFRA
jgi:SAM-dependent methyltransferase